MMTWGGYVVTKLVKAMIKKKIQVKGAKVLVLDICFKDNCPDICNTKIVDMVQNLKEFELDLDIYDLWIDPKK